MFRESQFFSNKSSFGHVFFAMTRNNNFSSTLIICQKYQEPSKLSILNDFVVECDFYHVLKDYAMFKSLNKLFEFWSSISSRLNKTMSDNICGDGQHFMLLGCRLQLWKVLITLKIFQTYSCLVIVKNDDVNN